MSSFAWQVALPERGASSLGKRKPRASLMIWQGEDVEEIQVPAIVAKAMYRARESGRLTPSSRAELLFELKRYETNHAMDKLSELVNRRDYSRVELSSKLCDYGFPSSIVEPALDRAVACGLVDDRRFASAYLRSKLSAGWGERRIARELSLRGIDVNDVEGWPYEFFDPDSEVDRAYNLVFRKRVSGKDPYGKLMRFLVGKGFAYGVANSAVRKALNDGDFE